MEVTPDNNFKPSAAPQAELQANSLPSKARQLVEQQKKLIIISLLTAGTFVGSYFGVRSYGAAQFKDGYDIAKKEDSDLLAKAPETLLNGRLQVEFRKKNSPEVDAKLQVYMVAGKLIKYFDLDFKHPGNYVVTFINDKNEDVYSRAYTVSRGGTVSFWTPNVSDQTVLQMPAVTGEIVQDSKENFFNLRRIRIRAVLPMQNEGVGRVEEIPYEVDLMESALKKQAVRPDPTKNPKNSK
jgi:hypothetical protein